MQVPRGVTIGYAQSHMLVGPILQVSGCVRAVTDQRVTKKVMGWRMTSKMNGLMMTWR